MKTRKVIDRKLIPTKIPFTLMAVVYLLLDKFNAPDLVWGILITLFSLYIIGCIVTIAKEDEVDILNKE